MKRLDHKVLIGLLVAAILVFMLWPSPERGPRMSGQALMPWDVQHTSDGHIVVLGMEIGVTTLNQARKVLGSHGEVALFQDKQGLSAEGFISEFTSGGLSGRIIVGLTVPEARLKEMAEHASKREHTDSGTLRLRPSMQDIRALGDAKIKSITYIPYVDLDDEVIRKRFGEPDKTVRINDQRTHYLYPDKGLDLILDTKGKEVAEYVDPSQFKMLEQPLESDKAGK